MTSPPTPLNQSENSFQAAELLLLLAVMIWGVNFVIVKAALSQLQPQTFNGIRFIIALVAFLLALRIKGIGVRIFSKDTWKFVLAGLLHTTFYQILFIEGIARTTASNSAMILAATPAAVAIISHFFRQENVTRLTWFGIVIAFGGLYLVIRASNEVFSFSSANFLGDLLTVCAMLLWSSYTVWARKLLLRFSPIELTALSTIYGTFPLLVWCIPSFFVQPWGGVDWAGWSGVIFSGLFSIVFAFIVWNDSVARVGPSRTAIFSNLIPIVAVITGVVFLKEPLTFAQCIGAICVISGVVLTRLRR